MGGNLGDAIAPLVVGPMLAVLNWRDVVVMNVVPGLIGSVLLLVLLGNIEDEGAGAGRARPDAAGALAAAAHAVREPHRADALARLRRCGR